MTREIRLIIYLTLSHFLSDRNALLYIDGYNLTTLTQCQIGGVEVAQDSLNFLMNCGRSV